MDIMQMGKNPNYMGAWDLDDVPGREIVLTIEKIVDEEVVNNGKKEVCTACYFTDKSYKPMILNVTNKKTLCRLYKTKDTEKLKGKSVVIGSDAVKAFGAVHDALRIRQRIPQISNEPAPKCENCGNDIAASGQMHPKQVAAYTQKKYGRCLCGSCATAIAKGAQ